MRPFIIFIIDGDIRDELEPWLTARAKQHPLAMSLPMLDGYVPAIVAGPLLMSPMAAIQARSGSRR